MIAFWEHGGFEQTSMSQLTTAMGISSPSLYAAFGSKRELFDEAVELYASRPSTPLTIAMEEPTAFAFATRLLKAAIDDCTNPAQPLGCLVNTDPLLVDRRDAGKAVITKRLARAVRAGEFPAGTSPKVLAEFLIVVINGLSTRARDGATRKELHRVAETALAGWPAPRS